MKPIQFVPLETGRICPKYGHYIYCYFVVEHPYDEIRKAVRDLLVAGCEYFVFYGSRAGDWLDTLEAERSCQRKQYLSVRHYIDPAEFAGDLRIAAGTRSIVPFDLFLIYDDMQVCRNMIKRLKTADGSIISS